MALVARQRTAAGPRSRAVALPCTIRAARRSLVIRAGVVEPGSLVLVAGASGGVGQLVTAKLLERGYRVRAVTRGGKGTALFPDQGDRLELVTADLRDAATLGPALAGVAAVCCCTGTTAFPSARWKGGNGPRETDLLAAGNLIRAAAAAAPAPRRFVFVTSAGVERTGSPPWSILNLFGVLGFKRQSEQALEASGLPYTIIRPSRLTDGPYTSYDLNTLLKGISGSRQAVTLALSDRLLGEASRIATAEAVVQSLVLPETENRAFAISSVEGEGPGKETDAWRRLFATAQ